MRSRTTVPAALICACAFLLPTVPALSASRASAPQPEPSPARGGASPAPLPNPVPSIGPETREGEVEALRTELKALTAQTPRNDKRIAAINARLAAINGQQARSAAENGGVATKTTISNADIESANAQNTYEAIKNVPGVTQADTSAAGGSDNLQIRGIKLASNTGYRLDGGLPMVNNIVLATEDKAQVQVLKGAGALEYGLASPAGVINYVLKRAGRSPVNTLSFSINDYGQSNLAYDFARRSGPLGVRLNLAGGNTGSYVAGAGGMRYLAALTADYTTRKMRVRVDVEQFGINLVEQGALLLNKADKRGSIALPAVPDPKKLLSGDWARSVGFGGNMSLRADYNVDEGFTLSAEIGRSSSRRAHRAVAQIGTINLTTGVGTETLSLVRDQTQFNTYENLEARFKSSHSFFSNVFSFGATRNSRDSNNPVTGKATFTQNVYDPTILPAPVFPSGPIVYQPQSSVDYDYFFQDSAALFNRFHLAGGVRQINYGADAQEVGVKPTHTKIAFLAPAIGAVVDITHNVSVYGSYVKSLEETPLAPINSKNSLALLPPEPSTQREIGFRFNRPRSYSGSLGYFFIERANASIDPVSNVYAVNGTNTFQGLESSVNLPLSSIWALNVGGQLMHATERAPGNASIDGKIPENTPRLSGNLGLTYRVRSVAGLALSAQANSLAARQINAQDQGTIPSITTYGFGASYAGIMNRRPLSVNLSVRNLTNKRYYSSIVNNVLGVAAPRTISLNMRMTP